MAAKGMGLKNDKHEIKTISGKNAYVKFGGRLVFGHFVQSRQPTWCLFVINATGRRKFSRSKDVLPRNSRICTLNQLDAIVSKKECSHPNRACFLNIFHNPFMTHKAIKLKELVAKFALKPNKHSLIDGADKRRYWVEK